MKPKLIQTKDYLLLVDEEAEIIEGNKYWNANGVHECNKNFAGTTPMKLGNPLLKFNKKVLSYYPLTKEAKELDLPLLPPFEGDVDIDKLADKEASMYVEKYTSYKHESYMYNECKRIFKEGYKAAQSKQFSLEEIEKKADVFARGNFQNSDKADFLSNKRNLVNFAKQFIQSLSNQQLPKEFISEYEYQTRTNEWKSILLPSEWFGSDEGDNPKRLKIITNSVGKQELVGTYIY